MDLKKELSEIVLEKTITHHVGNKFRDEGISLSESQLKIKTEIEMNILKRLFILDIARDNNRPLHFHHETDLMQNKVYHYVSQIFSEPENFEKISKDLAKWLYDNTTHPLINASDFYITYFKKCYINGVECDAIGLFKTEQTSLFQIEEKDKDLELNLLNGIHTKKTEKSCLIFNINKETGFLVNITDNTKNKVKTQYWNDDFLKVKPLNDDYYSTQNYLDMCKEFLKYKEVKKVHALDKIAQIELTNNIIDDFAQNEIFDEKDFIESIFKNKEKLKKYFEKYIQNYENAKDISLPKKFKISKDVVKKSIRNFKRTIQLDKNFLIKIMDNAGNIEQSYDEKKNSKYYKLYYDTEK